MKIIMSTRAIRYKRKITYFAINHYMSSPRPILFPIKRKLLKWANIEVGQNTRIVGPVICSLDCEWSVGKDTWIGPYIEIHGNGSVIIGDNCDLAPHVKFYTGSHKIGSCARRAGNGFCGTIEIGNGCWLCADSICLPNIKLGSGLIVAAGAVVAKGFEDNSMIGGCPAKVIRKL